MHIVLVEPEIQAIREILHAFALLQQVGCIWLSRWDFLWKTGILRELDWITGI